MKGGWIKLEKSLKEDPRIANMARELRNAYVTQGRFSESDACFTHAFFTTLVLGCLSRLWFYADTYIRQDDTISPLAIDGIDQIVGVQGFAQILPEDWLQVVDAKTIKLPGFQAHNGTDAKRQALNTKRVARCRERVALNSINSERSSNADVTLDELPDKTRPRQDQVRVTRTREDPTEHNPKISDGRIRECIEACKASWPKGGRLNWIAGEHLVRSLIAGGEEPDAIEQGVRRYAANCTATGRMPMNPSTFFAAADRPWAQDWVVPRANPAAAEADAKREAAWAEAKALAKAIGFRDPFSTESAAAYLTQVKQAELNKPRAPPKIAALAQRLQK